MALLNSINILFETAEQRVEREKYEAARNAFFESIPKRAEKTLIVGQSSESLVEELRKQLSELGVLRTLDQQRIAALEAELAQARAECERLMKLVMAVSVKYPRESRYDTAMRYIVEAETHASGPGQSSARKEGT